VPVRLSVASFNAENFYLLLDREYSRTELEQLDAAQYRLMAASIYNPNKSRSKIAAVAETILGEDFDLVGLCEIGGLETLENFNRLYLADRYECYLREENSSRGIYVGVLLKRGLFPNARVSSVPGSFSRNLLKVELGPEGGNLEAFVLHLKSQRGEDFGLDRRIDEVRLLASMIRDRRCLVMGDFNGVLIRGMNQFEYDPFLDLPLCDVLAAVGIPPSERRTHYYFGAGPQHSQLDYIFCTHDIEVLDAGVLEDEIPLSRMERDRLPSDHLFIRALLEVCE